MTNAKNWENTPPSFYDPEKTSILIAHEYPSLRAGFRSLLANVQDFQVLAETSTPVETWKVASELSPQVALISVNLCASISSQIIQGEITAKVMLMTADSVNDYHLAKMLEYGAVGYVSANESPEKLIVAIRRAARGEILFMGNELARARHWQTEIIRKWDNLTQREQQILWMLLKGLDNQSLADALGVTYKTIAFHIANILEKLNVRSRQEAITWMLQYFHPEALEEFPRLVVSVGTQ